MTTRWDLVAYDRNGQLVLIVEVKSKLRASPTWAARFRRNILAHGNFPNAPYFLMVFPDQFYLWKNNGSNQEIDEPNYVIDAQPILQPYFEQSGVTAEHVSGQSLELIVSSWLSNLMRTAPDDLEGHLQWSIDSGLLNAVAGGRLDQEVVV